MFEDRESLRAEIGGEIVRNRQLVMDHAGDLVAELRRAADRIERQVEVMREEVQTAPSFPAHGPTDTLVSTIFEEVSRLELWRRSGAVCMEAGAVRSLRALARVLSI